MYELKRKKINFKGIAMVTLIWITVALVCLYLVEFDVVYYDGEGNTVVCDVDGIYYTDDHPTCKKASNGKWKRVATFRWVGTCDEETGICIPTPR